MGAYILKDISFFANKDEKSQKDIVWVYTKGHEKKRLSAHGKEFVLVCRGFEFNTAPYWRNLRQHRGRADANRIQVPRRRLS